MEPEQSLRGRLLIASPALVDPNFRRTVVLVAEHNEEGVLGLVLTRPTAIPVTEAAPTLGALVDAADTVFWGGPVQPDAITVLAELEDPETAAIVVEGHIGFLPSDTDPDVVAGSTRRARVFAGYSGWGPGQLEDELEEEAWIVEEPAPGEIFAQEPEGLWSAVLRRMGGQYALLALMPLDPSVN
jgi:putative transcriptional regulator